VPNVFELEGMLSLVALVLLLGVKGYAFVNSVCWPSEAFTEADRLTKASWVAILALGLAAQLPILSGPLVAMINIAATVAALVYVVDVRPAVAAVSRPR
jgi:hypothetical protein